MRVLPPLPVMRSVSRPVTGASFNVIDNASETRRPEPYSSSSIAVSRGRDPIKFGRHAAIDHRAGGVDRQWLWDAVARSSARRSESSVLFLAISAFSSQRKNVRSAESARAKRAVFDMRAASRRQKGAHGFGVDVGDVGDSRGVADVALQPSQNCAMSRP